MCLRIQDTLVERVTRLIEIVDVKEKKFREEEALTLVGKKRDFASTSF